MKKILLKLRENLTAQLTALAGATGREVETLRGGLQQQLTDLAELEKLPDTEVNAALITAAGPFVLAQQEHAKQLFDQVTALRGQLATATASLTELNGKVTAGELVEKAKLTERCELAKTEGVESCAAEIADLRKKIVSGLPTPPANILKLPAAEFASAITDAQANLTSAKEKGLALDGKGKTFLARALWSKKDAFATEMAALESDGLLGAGRRGDPLMGGDHQDDPPAPRTSRVGMC